MVIDTFLTIGKTHKICEDYILSGTSPMPFIILSDGCSSSKGTDMGARVLCFLAKQYLKFRVGSEIDHDEMGLWIIHNAELASKMMGLPKNALDATLIIAYEHEPNQVRVHMYGDGCIIKFNKEFYELIEVSYSGNAPEYLSYKIDPVRHKALMEMNQDQTLKCYYSIGKQEETRYKKSVWDVDMNMSISGLIIASDGLVSFVESGKGLIDPTEYVEEFYSFKTTAGEFLKRRATVALRNLAKQNITNADDLSIGVFLKEDE